MESGILDHTRARRPPPRPERIRVMVVDDNAGFRESLLVLLESGQLDVVAEADSGERALELIDTSEPDVVLMDVRMPGIDGIETTRLLKERFPGIGVVALSGHEDQDIVRGMLVAGASGYVLKDSDGDEILGAVMHAAVGGGVLSPGVTPRVIEDLTEALERERQRSEELEEAHVALVERSARRHELVARLSHELRTPVTVILGMAQTLAKGAGTAEQQQELLDRLIQRTQDLVRLVERFEFTMDAGMTERVDVAELARGVARANPRTRVVEAEPRIAVASLNPVVAQRVLAELVDNALRFSPPDATVEVRLAPGPNGLEVRVVDQGAGIPAADRERVFGLLEQLEDLNVRVHQGAGIGLSLARTAARAMGGDVSVEASGREGTTFLWTIALDD